MRRPLLALALLLAACGDDTIIVNNPPGTGGAAEAGGGGESGGGGRRDGAGGEAPSTVSVASNSSASISSTASSGGAGSGDGGSGGVAGSGGQGGAGGDAPTCEAAECDDPDASCDPDCGPFSQTCNNVECEPFGSIGLFAEVSTIVFPVVDEQHETCHTFCGELGSWLAIQVAVPDDSCVIAYGPEGSSIERDGGACGGDGTSCLVTAVEPGDDDAKLTLSIPNGGIAIRSEFTIDIRPFSDCDAITESIVCAPAGCNGQGG